MGKEEDREEKGDGKREEGKERKRQGETGAEEEMGLQWRERKREGTKWNEIMVHSPKQQHRTDNSRIVSGCNFPSSTQ